MAKDKDKKEKKGFLGRIFGGKKEDGAPATPGASPEDTGAPPTPGGDFSPDAPTMEQGELADNAATIPPGYMKNAPPKGGKKGVPATPASPKGAAVPPTFVVPPKGGPAGPELGGFDDL